MVFTIWDLKLTREIPPGECGRKVKLKGIDGDLYKEWSMWFNSNTAKNLTNFCIRFQTARLDDVFTVVSFKRMLRNCKCFLYPTLHIKPLWISTKLTIFHISVPTTRVHGCRQFVREV
jgi:hypothetical protein